MITQSLKDSLYNITSAYFDYVSSISVLENIIGRHHLSNPLYLGGLLNKQIDSCIERYCKNASKLANNGTPATISVSEAKKALLGENASFSFYQYENESKPQSFFTNTIDDFISKCNQTSFDEFIKKESLELEDKGLSQIAQLLATKLGLSDTGNYTDKAMTVKGNKVNLYIDNNARWDLNNYSYTNTAFSHQMYELSNSLEVACLHTGITAINTLFAQLGEVVAELSIFSKLDSRYTIKLGGGQKVVVFKKYVQLTIDLETFDGLLSFLVNHIEPEFTLNLPETAAA